MRPLVAQCRLGLGKLYRRTGDQAKAERHLTTAVTMYRKGMTFWLEQAEAELGCLTKSHPEPDRLPTPISRTRCLVLVDRFRTAPAISQGRRATAHLWRSVKRSICPLVAPQRLALGLCRCAARCTERGMWKPTTTAGIRR